MACDSCKKRFTIVKNLTAHVKSIHQNKLEKCSVCEKTVRDTHLKRHEASCRKKYTKSIQKHYIDNVQAKTYSLRLPCDQCEYKATSKSSMK